MLPRLPIVSLFFTAYATVFSHGGDLFRALLMPTLGLLLLATFENIVAGGIFVTLIFWLLGLPLAVLTVTACHRLFLLGVDSLASPFSIHWSPRETSMLVWTIILSGFMYLAIFVLGVVFLMSPERAFGFDVPWLGSFLTVLVATYFQSRFLMVLPATALDRRMFLSGSWYLTAGNGPRLAILLLLPVGIYLLLVAIIGPLLLRLSVPLFFISTWALAFITTIVDIAALSLSYRFLENAASSGDEF